MEKQATHTTQEEGKIENILAHADQLKARTPEEIAGLSHDKYATEPSKEGTTHRLDYLKSKGIDLRVVPSANHLLEPDALKGNIENFIGMAQLPIGLAGPMLVNGSHAYGDFHIPLATTEGALVASYNRGMKACRLSGGITTVSLAEGVQRSPYFKFDSLITVGIFVKWVHENTTVFVDIVKETSNHARLSAVKNKIEGNSVILIFEYLTGDAAGQNMVTICTDRICKYILANFATAPKEWYLESNYSGDKKATTLAYAHVRGKKVTAEIVLPKSIVESILKSTPEKISKYWQSSTLAVTQSGAIGAQGHIANGLTALFIACGQDVACISESSIGLTRMEVTENGDLYVSVTLPSLIVGTVGGGTGLPTQKECLSMLDCYGPGKAKKFAEICCAVALAGEVSIASAMSADHFTRAHETLGRK